MEDLSSRTLRHAWRESRFVLVVWLIALIWTVGYCYLCGYQHSSDNELVLMGLAEKNPKATQERMLGMPAWIFWGIFVPTIACTAITCVFGVWGMADDNLGTEQEAEQS